MSELQPDSLEAFDRLLSEQSSYINEVDREIAKWTQFQVDYRHLQTRLSTLPDRLTHECMVPFGKLAFIPGRIIHSNEILVLLGDNYFTERSCKQAMEIVQRRLENIDENLRKHQKEKEIFDQQKKYTNRFLDDKTKFIEIKETDEEEKKPTNRRAKLTEEEIQEERRRLQERAMKMNQTTSKHVHFQENQMDVDSDDDDDGEEIPHQQFKKILIHHTKTDSQPIEDSSSTLFSHPGAIGKSVDSSSAVPDVVKTPEPVAFTGKTIEREMSTHVEPPPPKRLSKFKASRQ
jgi:unconventional prefoldin RPB5 interactor 1